MSDNSMGNFENDSGRDNSFKSAGNLVNQLIGGVTFVDKQKDDRLSGRILLPTYEPDY